MEEPKALNKKLRLQLFDENFNQLSDRLVGQDLELDKGPKEAHKGPMKIEVCLFDKADVDAFIGYLERVQGKLPLESKTKKIKLQAIDTNADGWREEFITKIQGLINNGDIPTQEILITHLRSNGFVFLTWDALPEQVNPPTEEAQDYPDMSMLQWMLPITKEAKNPINNRYDPKIMFGFSLIGKKLSKVYVATYLELNLVIPIKWENKNENQFRKTEMSWFPQYMTLEEREKFRIELYKLRKEPEMVPSKFFKRWYKDVDFREKEEWAERLA